MTIEDIKTDVQIFFIFFSRETGFLHEILSPFVLEKEDTEKKRILKCRLLHFYPAIEYSGTRICITKTRLFKYIENFTTKNWKFSDKKIWYFS